MKKHSDEFSVLETDKNKTYEYNHKYGHKYDTSKEIPNSKEGSYNICPQDEEWTSPSDLIINLVDLKPPLTSKITRGKAHVGIESIGEMYLEIEKEVFEKSLMKALKGNDDTWEFILKKEIIFLHKQVKNIFRNILEEKRNILAKEMSSFYEKSLAELEKHVKTEVKTMAYSFRVGLTDQLNRKIDEKLESDRQDLEKKLNEELNAQLKKIRSYYEILLKNEVCKYTALKNKVIQNRNDAIKSFYRQVESERLTSTLYVLCSERKKCKVKKLFLESIEYNEIMNHLKILVQKDNLLKELVGQNEILPILNRQWQEQIVKILRLFLKFISLSLNLLPEQTTFLLDFEKMVILQLNEFQKQPNNPPELLVNKEDEMNRFKFQELKSSPAVCDEEPFQIAGNLDSPLSLFLKYGSRETIGSEADYPYFRVQKRYIYAKCHGFDKIKELLGTNICRSPSPEVQTILSPIINFENEERKDYLKSDDDSQTTSNSSSIHMGPDVNKVNTTKECPNNCGKSIRDYVFPNYISYLDYDEKNYENLASSIGIQEPQLIYPIKVKNIVFEDVAFPAMKEDFKTVATQCSSQDGDKNIIINNNLCDCTKVDNCNNTSKGCKVHDIFLKRELSLKTLLKTNPKLFYILFSDESYNSKVH